MLLPPRWAGSQWSHSRCPVRMSLVVFSPGFITFKCLSLPLDQELLKRLPFISLFLALDSIWHIVGAHQMFSEWWNATSFMGYHLQTKWQSCHPEPCTLVRMRTDFRTENPRGCPETVIAEFNMRILPSTSIESLLSRMGLFPSCSP